MLQGVWEEIKDVVSGGYSFNKSYSVSYAVISQYTASHKYFCPDTITQI